MTLNQRLTTDVDRRIARGVVAGSAAGLLFLLANMWFAVSQGMPAASGLLAVRSGLPDGDFTEWLVLLGGFRPARTADQADGEQDERQ